MSTTTEPPYLHKSSGIAPRNGTSSHTITFTTDGSAPFTPTNGSLLVFTIFGPVTHTGPGAPWTEQLQPVNSGELSVFTATASSTTSITITHNASNAPCPWEVKEYPSGSTYVSGAGDSQASNSVPPTLTSGLVSGTPRVIESVVALVSSSTGDSATGTTWTSPWVEDSDQFIVKAATDGAYMSSAHQINNTTTSVSPNPTGFDGGLAVGNRQAVTFAIDAVAPVTTITKDTAEAYRVFNAVTKDTQETYRVLNSVTKDTSETYRVLNSVTKDAAETYRVYNSVTKATPETYRVLNSVTRDLNETYRVYNSVTKDATETYRVFNAGTKDTGELYRVLNALTKDTVETYRVLNLITKDVVETYDVQSGTGVVKTITETYRIFNAVTKNVSETYRVFNHVTVDKVESYRVFNAGTLSTSVWSPDLVEVPATIQGLWDGNQVVACTIELAP